MISSWPVALKSTMTIWYSHVLGQAEYNCKTPQENWSLGQDMNCGPLRHDTRVPLTWSQHLLLTVYEGDPQSTGNRNSEFHSWKWELFTGSCIVKWTVYITETRNERGFICCKICECAEMMWKHYNREKIGSRDQNFETLQHCNWECGETLHWYGGLWLVAEKIQTVGGLIL